MIADLCAKIKICYVVMEDSTLESTINAPPLVNFLKEIHPRYPYFSPPFVAFVSVHQSCIMKREKSCFHIIYS